MPVINNCARYDIHSVGAFGPGVNVPLIPRLPPNAVQPMADGIARVRAYQSLLRVIADKVRDLRNQYQCQNPRCPAVSIAVDPESVSFKLLHSARRGNAWHAHYNVESELRVYCARRRPGAGGGDDGGEEGASEEDATPEQDSMLWDLDEHAEATIAKLGVALTLDAEVDHC